jgi:hypothetical protein
VKKIICYLLDREQAWADTWGEVGESMQLNLFMNTSFQQMDVTNPQSWQNQQRFLQADLFTLSYFVSEVTFLNQGGVVDNFLAMLFSNAKSGALFIYDDNGHGKFNDYFDAQWQAAGLECILEATNEHVVPRAQEQASEVAIYKAKFGQSPKIRAYYSYRVLKKP